MEEAIRKNGQDMGRVSDTVTDTVNDVVNDAGSDTASGIAMDKASGPVIASVIDAGSDKVSNAMPDNTSEKAPEKKRALYLDALKVIALVLVFALHTQRGVEDTDPLHNAVLFYGARCAMPIFFMVNGALIMSKESFTFAYYKKKILNMIRIFIIWGTITVFYALFYMRVGLYEALKNGVKVLVAKHWVINLWFFFTFAIIYTVLLFWFQWIKRNIVTLTLILGVVCVCLGVISDISVLHGGYFVQAYVTQRLRLWTWFFYFFLGYVLRTFELDQNDRVYVFLITALSFGLAVFLQYILAWCCTGQIESNYMYDNLLLVIYSSFVFLSFRIMPKVSAWLSRFVGPSFGAFLLHSYFIDALNLRASSNAVQAFFVWVGLVVCMWFLSWCLSKIPVVREAFRY